VLFGIARTSTVRWVAWPAGAIVHTLRGLPVLMLIFWAYFIVPLLTGKSISGTTTVICALVAYETAFLGEVIKAGIQAIPQGQVEASRSLGMSYSPRCARWKAAGAVQHDPEHPQPADLADQEHLAGLHHQRQ
jgi:polar amino acid transport system permease protein